MHALWRRSVRFEARRQLALHKIAGGKRKLASVQRLEKKPNLTRYIFSENCAEMRSCGVTDGLESLLVAQQLNGDEKT